MRYTQLTLLLLWAMALTACPFVEPFCRDPSCVRDAGSDRP